ncbi:NAD(P)H-binding protein [Herbiconiux daphne]|uniref:NAD(P)H-binding protein n=1 Tax=Herbiconiux daphne TaxID=2970914 RepID=A0ABT2GZP3_9MICO|nr:NAD(P)H-binding protein [Herbiconiux daphne]MCS5733431.1 NAD(P)H-binding protein [Herbiconiux daphne]
MNGATLDHLLQRMPPSRFVVVARDPAKAQRFADLGVTVRRGDYADPSSLAAAFDGADQLLLISSSDPAGNTAELHRNAVDAAVRAGVGRILYTSHQGAALGSPFGPGHDHAVTEGMLAESGLPWTSLRNGFYAPSLAWLAGPWRDTGVIAVPGDGPVSWTARADAAEAAAVILASDGGFDGPVTLTASAAPTFDEVAEIASELSGRDVTRVLMGDDEWVAAQVAGGQPERMARFMLGMYQAAAEGLFAGTDPLLGSLLEREPQSVRDALEAPLSAAR